MSTAVFAYFAKSRVRMNTAVSPRPTLSGSDPVVPTLRVVPERGSMQRREYIHTNRLAYFVKYSSSV